MNKSKQVFNRLLILIGILLILVIALSYRLLWDKWLAQQQADLLVIGQLQTELLEQRMADKPATAASSLKMLAESLPSALSADNFEILRPSLQRSNQNIAELYTFSAEQFQLVQIDLDSEETIYSGQPQQSGTRLGVDHQGEKVVAALVAFDNQTGILIVKKAVAEMQTPFIRVVAIVFIILVALILLLVKIFRNLVEPVAEEMIGNEQRFRNLVENINEWIFEMDRFGKMIYSSPRVAEILGYDQNELLGYSIYSLMMELDGDDLQALLTRRDKQQASVHRKEYSFINRQLEVVMLEISIECVLDEKSQLLGYRGFAQDISERIYKERELKNYQNKLEMMVADRTLELQQLNRELTDFSYIVSHDLRSPLVSISGFAAELRTDIKLIADTIGPELANKDSEKVKESMTALDETIPESLYFIEAAIDRMNRLIHSILALSRLGERTLNYETVNVKKLLVDTVDAMAFQIEQLNVSVKIADLPVIKTDALALEQIFGNLLDNAVKYLDPTRSGVVEISCEQQSSQVVFYIQDNGVGIAEKDLTSIYKLFKRFGDQKVSGEGMGLTYVQTLVRRLGGKITCRSKPGVGTVFSFSLPL